jgi:hypothetical protein
MSEAGDEDETPESIASPAMGGSDVAGSETGVLTAARELVLAEVRRSPFILHASLT